ncbi:hypothetical protein C0995_002302 [Termitomyces sp. Mi166|nr:hypothetical protein C0995_002302 [Termitomyces sp. Mi166\
MCFSNLIFKKLLPVAQNKGARVVALNRRHYPGSTEYSAEELAIVVNGGTEAQKDAEFQTRGLEIATFIDNFIVQYNLPPISEDGKTGGIILLGWSLGSVQALATISSAHALSVDVRARLGAYKSDQLVQSDPHPILLGFPVPEQNWTPIMDTYIPQDLRLSAFGQWATGYFDHGDIAKRDLDALQWVLPSSNHVPTLFKIPPADRAEMECYGGDAFSDMPYMFHFSGQFKASYRKAINDPETLKIFPALRCVILAGEKSGAFAVAGMWAVEDDQKEAGGSTHLAVNLVPGINHFWHWEDPEKALDYFLACTN